MLFLILNTLSFEGKCCSGRWPTLYGWPSLQNGCRQVRCWKHALFCIWSIFTHYMQLTPEWQDTELQPCWCPGSFHQCLCWRHRTMESGKKTLIPPPWVIIYLNRLTMNHAMLLAINSIFHLPGAVHQPARGAALLLRSQAAPSPCSRCSQVASIQVELIAFCLLKMLTLLIHHSSRPGLKLDERSAALIQMKCLPLASAIQTLYPDMYR